MSTLIDKVKEIEQALENANMAAIKVKASGLYSPAGAQQMANKLLSDARQQAQTQAEEIKRQAAQGVAMALADYQRIYAQVSEEQATPRAAQTFAVAQARVNTVKANAEIIAIVDRALLVNDQTQFIALHDVTIPMLMSKASQGPSGLDRMTLQGLMTRIYDAVRLNGDQRVPQAEARLQAAQEEQAAVRMALESVNFRQSLRTGGRGPLDTQNGFFDVSNAAAVIPEDVMQSFSAASRLVN